MGNKIKPAAVPLPAATLIIIRQNMEGLQVYLLKRHPRSSFMAGNYVFPGGMVEPTDKKVNLWGNHVDLDLEEIARKLGGDLSGAEALTFAVAAIRETFEETGVLLADPAGSSGETLEELGEKRLRFGMSKGWLLKQARSEGWVLTLSTLFRWSHWITPKRMQKRFDTRFFLIVLPHGQTCRPDTRETVDGIWISPEKALSANLSGEVPLSPPTLIVLHELLPYTSVSDLVASTRDRAWGSALLPRLISPNEETIIIEPWDVHYHKKKIQIDPSELNRALLPVGEPFSRLWYSAGRWRPVRSG
jgi:8-oxo-dGTP pyrophosphatase MutT (NUDIX family)